MTGQDDQLLLPRVAQGEPGSVEACLDRFGGLVWSLARRMCPTRIEAEDAVQEIFVEVWRTAGRYDSSIASEATFIAMIARRRLIDRQRRAGRRPSENALVDESTPGTVTPDRSADGVLLDEDAALARSAIAQLSEEQQRVLQLAFYFGQSHEKISASTGLPLGTVKTHARRGLIKVREILRAERKDTARRNGSPATAQEGGV